MEGSFTRKDLISADRLRELTERSDLAGTMQAVSHFGAIAASGSALWSTWGTLWSVPLFIVHGMLVNYLFAAQHECNHYTAFRTRWVNDVVNRITGFVLLYPRSYERWFHFEHHRYTQDWDRDPEISGRQPFRLVDYLLYLTGISYWGGLVRRMVQNACGHTVGEYFTADQRRHIMLEARWHLAGYAAIAAASLWWQSSLALVVWLAPMLCTKILHQVQNITEHTGAPHVGDMLRNTRTIETWRILRWMCWNMQYHAAHHAFPAVPFHRLPELHREIVDRLGTPLPTTGYLAFQRDFITSLVRGHEPELREPSRTGPSGSMR